MILTINYHLIYFKNRFVILRSTTEVAAERKSNACQEVMGSNSSARKVFWLQNINKILNTLFVYIKSMYVRDVICALLKTQPRVRPKFIKCVFDEI